MSEGQNFVDWLLSVRRFRCFARIERTYLNDSFNFYGLRQKIPRYKEALALLREESLDFHDDELIEQTIRLYGLVHARYIGSIDGMEKMHNKYTAGHFQRCPRVLCNGCSCLPYGCSEVEGEGSLKMYCPNCGDVYDPENSEFNSIDGAYFGPSWVHIITQQYEDMVPDSPPRPYVPRIFGFRLSRENFDAPPD